MKTMVKMSSVSALSMWLCGTVQSSAVHLLMLQYKLASMN